MSEVFSSIVKTSYCAHNMLCNVVAVVFVAVVVANAALILPEKHQKSLKIVVRLISGKKAYYKILSLTCWNLSPFLSCILSKKKRWEKRNFKNMVQKCLAEKCCVLYVL